MCFKGGFPKPVLSKQQKGLPSSLWSYHFTPTRVSAHSTLPVQLTLPLSTKNPSPSPGQLSSPLNPCQGQFER